MVRWSPAAEPSAGLREELIIAVSRRVKRCAVHEHVSEDGTVYAVPWGALLDKCNTGQAITVPGYFVPRRYRHRGFDVRQRWTLTESNELVMERR